MIGFDLVGRSQWLTHVTLPLQHIYIVQDFMFMGVGWGGEQITLFILDAINNLMV
jgi:hypothetical protein